MLLQKKRYSYYFGCRLDLLDGLKPACLSNQTLDAYSQLCNLLTTGNRRAEKGECHLYKADVYPVCKGYEIYCAAT